MQKELEQSADCTIVVDINIQSASSALLTIYEGKYHQVKRMFTAVGNKITYLKRMSMGELKLDPKLELGEYRLLTEEEILSLQ